MHLQKDEVYLLKDLEVEVKNVLADGFPLAELHKVISFDSLLEVCEHIFEGSRLAVFTWKVHLKALVKTSAVRLESGGALSDQVSVGELVTVSESVVFFEVNLVFHRKRLNEVVELLADKLMHVLFHAHVTLFRHQI